MWQGVENRGSLISAPLALQLSEVIFSREVVSNKKVICGPRVLEPSQKASGKTGSVGGL